ncbi:hypothetical protein EDC61_11966 [Sulfuritortus calidifontis]|uniref:Mu-like prophage FluMu N-terminal domain-containing protein n=1 Tax=Sulfuritortus calidifontis TaxID=1914471 RepID=A0A4R3JRR4_9PROT|nr:hypothetical protein [Sulfuritortus calidifontis]TCS69765.1 hypothetical protein EDC61_11966 [Sulfuritortus calidifontis]
MAKKPADTQSGTVRLMVRTAASHGDHPRYRAGLGPFTREPRVVEVTPAQAAELKADPALAVAEVGQE